MWPLPPGLRGPLYRWKPALSNQGGLARVQRCRINPHTINPPGITKQIARVIMSVIFTILLACLILLLVEDTQFLIRHHAPSLDPLTDLERHFQWRVVVVLCTFFGSEEVPNLVTCQPKHLHGCVDW